MSKYLHKNVVNKSNYIKLSFFIVAPPAANGQTVPHFLPNTWEIYILESLNLQGLSLFLIVGVFPFFWNYNDL